MRQTVYALYNEKNREIIDKICDSCEIDKMYFSEELVLTADILTDMANNCLGNYFYVINSELNIVFPEFNFSFRPAEWDKEYVHIWNNDTTVRLFNKSQVVNNPHIFTDQSLLNGSIKLKSIAGKIFEYPVFDIIFLSYDEVYADVNFEKLKERFPRAKRLHNIKGIYEAHKAAARWAEYDKSDMFYVVDADAQIVPTFNFDYIPSSYDLKSVHVWHSRNPVNDLEYGYGGIKLFPTKSLIEYNGSPLDFTTSVSAHFKVMPEVSNVTKFNTDPFSAWRSGFRECAKLASKLITNQNNTDTEYRLNVWCSKGEDREFGDFTIMGANEGREFGLANKDQPDMLGLINDFKWLETRFGS